MPNPLLDNLLKIIEIEVHEVKMRSPGMLVTEGGTSRIYLKEGLIAAARVAVLLHEYSHYIHLTHFFTGETRAECELIATGAAYRVSHMYGVALDQAVRWEEYPFHNESQERLKGIIDSVSAYIIGKIELL